jgi:uncharacterized protein (TIGR00369 family)
MSDDLRARIQALIDRSPYGAWLGLRIVSANAEGELDAEIAWRNDFVSAPERQALHGGVTAGLLDACAVFAVVARNGALAATVDLRTDYHAIPAPGLMRVTARVVRGGRTLSTADAALYGADGKLAASGRATVMTLNAAPTPM